MSQVCVVLDTHVFLKGLSGFSKLLDAQHEHEADEVKVCRHILKICYRLGVNDDIRDEYTRIARRAGLSPLFVRDRLAELARIGKVEHKGKYADKKPVEVGPEQDRPFVEVAKASSAKYVVTRDPDFETFSEIAKEHRFAIVSPAGYLQRENAACT